ncbi:M13 family metallopeptidase [Brevibacterium album]|uniref:M13 family metallopeptidase n=1 Tax=Brevibacterium album TaxID=417948 RepID=UPI00048BF102|nr:M13-type metalloendopeptidase [Brevibacterium album]
MTSHQDSSQDTQAGDPGIRPQDDLYRHVNGGWIERHVIPDDRAADGEMRRLFDEAEEKVRTIIAEAEDPKVANLFASFMDEETIAARGLEPLAGPFEAVLAAPDRDALVAALARLEKEGAGGALAAYVSADAADPEHYALYLHQGGLSLPDESYYREDSHAAIREAFRAHAARMLSLAGVDARTGRSAEELAEAVFAFETALASHHWDVVASRDAEKTYNALTVADAAERAGAFDLRGWLEASDIAGAGGEPSHLVVAQPSFLSGLGEEWERTPLEDLKAWAMLGIAHAYAGYLDAPVVEENFDFYGRTLSGTPQMRERWKRGVSLVENLLGEAVGRIYVASEFPPESKQAIGELVDALIAAYDSSIRGLDWMSEETKGRALEKLSLFTPKVGYPDRWREYPAEILADDLVGNVRRSTAAEHARQVNRIGKPIDRTEWLMTPQTVNAYYHPVMNEIVFPAAILQPPFFDPEASDAVNFGAIGAVIGHEIGHGFDDQGSRYDGHGRLTDWWTQADREGFEQRTGTLIEQYDALVPAGLEADEHVNGALTIGENIGDLGGLTIGWKALGIRRAQQGREITAEDGRAFFTQWARAWRSTMRTEERRRRLTIDPHSPEEFRCNQVVKNMDAFAEVFDVRPGDGMWLDPADRVTIW